MSETLMTTDAANTTEGQDASQSGDQSATAAGEVVQQQPAASAPVAEVKPQGAPDKYEFAPVEGVSLGEGVMTNFSEVAKELNLSQESAQKVLTKMAPAIQAHQMAQLESARSEWAKAATTDAEFGGERLQENLAVAKKAVDAFGDTELKTLLNESGLGNHPAIIRAFFKAGKAISEDRIVTGSANVRNPEDRAARLYPSTTK
jgi:hypothetical protein